jgi:hypothetical protein
LLVCDYNNNKLRRVQLNGILSPFENLNFVFLTLKQGEVSTLCEINEPISVAVTANNTILVGSNSNKLFKVTHQGEFN